MKRASLPLRTRRQFITLLGGAAATWPIAARGQQPGEMRRIGALLGFAENDQEAQARIAAFRQALRELGWIEGRNLRIDYRWVPSTGPDGKQAFAAELVRLNPEIILVNGPGDLTAVQRESRSIPIVFTSVNDPVNLGFVESLARPGGNVTGFSAFEGSAVGKLLEALKEVAPHVARVLLIFNPDNVGAAPNLRSFETAAPLFAVTPIVAPVRDPADIERAIEAFARESNGGLLVPTDTTVLTHRELVVDLAARHRLPAVYPERSFVTAGGLMFYGADRVDQFRRAASYVDRILKGAKPADLPVQLPTKFQFAINLKTASALSLAVPPSTLLRADEVIE